jgi:copper homeostasis protein (lipoprotein)
VPASTASADRLIRRLAGLSAVFTVWALSAQGSESVAVSLPGLPASFAGVLPCAGSPGSRAQLDLWPDGVFHLQRECAGSPAREDDRGRWRATPQHDGIRLHGGRETVISLVWQSPQVLVLHDARGLELGGDSFELRRLPDFRPAPLVLNLHGMFRYVADAASFEECLTGRIYPVAIEGDYGALESAYLASAEAGTGEAIMASFDGEIAYRPAIEGERVTPTVVVRRFVNLWPDGRCERAMGRASLAETYWRLVRLRGAPVTTPQGERETHLVLRSGDHRYHGGSGCFRFAGRYQVNGDEIGFEAPVWTAEATCEATEPNPTAPTESDLAGALHAVRRWTINAGVLECFDGAGSSLALFEAVYLR